MWLRPHALANLRILGDSSNTKDVRSLLKDKCKEPGHRGPQLRSDSTVSPPSLTRCDEAWAFPLPLTRSLGVSWEPGLQLPYPFPDLSVLLTVKTSWVMDTTSRLQLRYLILWLSFSFQDRTKARRSSVFTI